MQWIRSQAWSEMNSVNSGQPTYEACDDNLDARIWVAPIKFILYLNAEFSVISVSGELTRLVLTGNRVVEMWYFKSGAGLATVHKNELKCEKMYLLTCVPNEDASAQSDQSLRCPLVETLYPSRQVKILITLRKNIKHNVIFQSTVSPLFMKNKKTIFLIDI